MLESIYIPFQMRSVDDGAWVLLCDFCTPPPWPSGKALDL